MLGVASVWPSLAAPRVVGPPRGFLPLSSSPGPAAAARGCPGRTRCAGSGSASPSVPQPVKAARPPPQGSRWAGGGAAGGVGAAAAPAEPRLSRELRAWGRAGAGGGAPRFWGSASLTGAGAARGSAAPPPPHPCAGRAPRAGPRLCALFPRPLIVEV